MEHPECYPLDADNWNGGGAKMIINTVHQYARKEDYDGYNDYYVNPEFKQPFERYARARIEIGEDENGGKSTKKVGKNRKMKKKVHFLQKNLVR